MTHKTLSSWEWGRGSDPVEKDIPDWVISLTLWGILVAADVLAIYWLVNMKKAQHAPTQEKQKIENVIQMRQTQEINKNTKNMTIYRNVYIR